MSASTAPIPVVDIPGPARQKIRQPVRPHRDLLRTVVRFTPLLGPLMSLTLVWWGLDTGVLRSLENLQGFIGSLGIWGPTVFIVIAIASVMFPMDPVGLPVIAAPILFGPLEGTLYSYLAVCLGSLLNFAIARRVGVGLIERIFSPRTVERCLGWTRSPRFAAAFAVAIVSPVAPDDLLCYVAGTTRMRWRTFALIILLGKPFALIAYGLGVSTLLLRILPW